MNHKEYRVRLEEIVYKYINRVTEFGGYDSTDIKQFKQAITDLMVEVVGEKKGKNYIGCPITDYNQAKEEILNTIKCK